jgi:hypothetical protein
VAAIDDSMLPALETQSKSQAAENAVRLNVYQADEGEAPAAIPEPVLRRSEKVEAAPSEDVSDVIKKWSKKK